MFIEREGVIILHLDPPQSAYMEAAVSVQAVAAVHSWLILSPYPLLLHSKSGKSGRAGVKQLKVTLLPPPPPRLSRTIIIDQSIIDILYQVLDFCVY